MRPRSALRAGVAVLAISALLAPSAARADQPAEARIGALLRQMSLREKVGQLFVVEVYGQDAGTVAAGNRTLYGVDTPAQVIDKYRPGGVIYFDARRGPDNLRDPRQIATLSNGRGRCSGAPPRRAGGDGSGVLYPFGHGLRYGG